MTVFLHTSCLSIQIPSAAVHGLAVLLEPWHDSSGLVKASSSLDKSLASLVACRPVRVNEEVLMSGL